MPKKTPVKSLDLDTAKTSVENKITMTSLLLSYQFEYGVNFNERIINLTGDIDETMFFVLDSALNEMETKSKKDIVIKIHSVGGNVYDALAIVGRITECKCKIITKGYGCVMSAATLILASGTRRREISKYGRFMWHEASYSLEGKHSEIKATVKEMEREEALFSEYMAEFTKKDAKFWRSTGVHEDAYFSPNQLKSFGVVDEVF